METVEVWMWIIAGLLIGGIIFGTSYSLMSQHVKSQERLQAAESFNQLYELMNTVCLSGINALETRQIIFPYSVERVYIKDDNGMEEKGQILCYKFKDSDAVCKRLDLCSAKMSSIGLTEKTSLFYMIQKALGSKYVANIEFKVEKSGLKDLNVTWKRRYVK